MRRFGWYFARRPSVISHSREHSEFIGEELHPVAGEGDALAMSRGEPGLPRRFLWRGREYRVIGVIETWKTSGPCRNGSGEMYLRKHWYRIRVEPVAVLTVYCDRQARDRERPKARWWVFSGDIYSKGRE
jgi:hypothetical protein